MSILISLIVLSILILVHELGHYWAAKKSGVWVEEFGIGLPPRIIGKKIRGTIYSINLLPFGGFVRLHGEHMSEGVTKPKEAFINKSKKTRALITSSGVFMNFFLAVVAFAITYSFLGIPKDTENVRVIEIAKDSPAELAGLLSGDIIQKVDGTKIVSTDRFIEEIEKNIGVETTLTIERNEKILEEAKIIPRKDPPENQGPIGVVISTVENYFPPIWQRPFIGIYWGFKEAIFWGREVLVGLGTIILNLFKGVAPKEIAGPIGIYALTSTVAKFGLLPLISFVGILSVNLMILNIIPFPALDGGRLLFILIESIFGRRVLPRVEAAIHSVGLLVLIAILIVITVYDISRLREAGGISNFIDSVLK